MNMSSKPLELWLDRSNVPKSNTANGDKPFPHSTEISRTWTGCDGVRDVAEITLENEHSQNEALSLVGLVSYIFVRCPNWTMIPLENLVAACQGTSTKVACALQSADQVPGAAKALQIGVDALVLEYDDNVEPTSLRDSLWAAALEEMRARPKARLTESANEGTSASIVTGTVTRVAPCLLGERVCIDLIERLVPGEGAYVGSVSQLMCLVHSECLESQYVSSRPFRVNAGPVSSYVLMEGGATKYLSEIKGGDRIIVVDTTTKAERGVTVGRAKIERRPFLVVEYTHSSPSGKTTASAGEDVFTGQTVLQQAETVRLFSAGGGVVSVTDLEVGSEILLRKDFETKMRHLGRALGDGEMREQ